MSIFGTFQRADLPAKRTPLPAPPDATLPQPYRQPRRDYGPDPADADRDASQWTAQLRDYARQDMTHDWRAAIDRAIDFVAHHGRAAALAGWTGAELFAIDDELRGKPLRQLGPALLVPVGSAVQVTASELLVRAPGDAGVTRHAKPDRAIGRPIWDVPPPAEPKLRPDEIWFDVSPLGSARWVAAGILEIHPMDGRPHVRFEGLQLVALKNLFTRNPFEDNQATRGEL